MESDTAISFSYRGRRSSLIWAIVFFGAAALLFASMAVQNRAGAEINGFIKLSPTGATIFYWVMFACSMVFVGGSIAILFSRRIREAKLEISPAGVKAPYGFLQRRSFDLKFADLEGITETTVNGQRFLYLYSGGERYPINAIMLPSANDYEQVKALVSERVTDPDQEGWDCKFGMIDVEP